MPNLIRAVLTSTLVLLAPVLTVGCASTPTAPATPVDPSKPVEINGARYKLVESGGSLDQRVVEFMKASDTIRGCLVTFGMRLRNVTGLDNGVPVFQARQNPNNPNEYSGGYKSIQPDGQIQDKEVTITFVGDEMRWNLESATWSRQEETNQMTEEEKKKCKGK